MSQELPQPVSSKLLTRILVLVIVLLSFLAGYYHSAWQIEQQKTIQLTTTLEEKL